LAFIDENALLLLDKLPEALVVTERDGTIIYFNKASESLTEYRAAEVLGQNVTLLIPKPARQRVNVVEWLDRWARHPDSAQLQFLHLTGRTRSGLELSFSVRVSSFGAKDAPYFAIVFRDISQELQTQTDLKQAHLLTRRILAISEDAVLTVNDQQEIQYWNRKAEETFGYTADEILGKQLSVLIPQGLHDSHRKHIETFVKGKTASRMMGERGEITGLHKEGHSIALEASITKTVIDGKTVLSAHLRDISDRKQSEQELLESELRYRAIFDNALEAMALLSPEGKVIEFNDATTKLLGDHKGTSTTGNSYFWELDWWKEITNQAELQQVRHQLRQNVERAMLGESIRTQVSLYVASGQQRQIDFSLLPVIDPNGKVTYIIAEGRDITPFVSA
jgi:PAS domain S-box-containing protein